MSTNKLFKASRRDFMKLGAVTTGGLLLGMPLGCTNEKVKYLTGNSEASFNPNVFISIQGDGEVTLIAHRSEMGTGIKTSLPLVIADEMEADWEKITIEQAQGDAKYGDQNTDGSYSVRMFYHPMRVAGATIKLMMLQAAAKEWEVEISECKAENHTVIHSSGKVFGYGFLANKAALLPVPEEADVTLKSPEDFKYISRKTSIYDLNDIVTGKAQYGLDVNIPNAKVAVIKRNPEAGAGISSFDSDEASKIDGVSKIFELEASGFPMGFGKPVGGIVVVADNTWTAIKAREALSIKWSKGKNAGYSTSDFSAKMQTAANKPGKIKREQGDIKTALSTATKVVSSDFQVPHFAHSSMETPCAVADVKEGSCEIWAPVQSPQWVRGAVASALGLEEENVTINITLIGSAFGRKSKPDFVVEAALISKEIGGPVKLLWTREDDIQHDFYHFNCAQHMEVSLDEENKVSGWLHRSVFPPIGGTANSKSNEASTGQLCMGALDMPFEIENISCETAEAQTQIRVGWLRSVGNINHGFALGSMLDQVAEARGIDPIENALELLGNDRLIDFEKLVPGFTNYSEKVADFPCDVSRIRNVVETVKEKSNWNNKLGSGKGMGFAVHRSFLTYVACVVEVEVSESGRIKIPMVHYAVDCGTAVNPDRIKAQFEGGAAFGASLALKSEITVKDGAVEQDNFHNYLVARITDAPYKTEVHIIENNEKPTGVGEPPVPPFIPALANAIYNATGERITKLPIKLS
ncbi:MAG: isoquinoline 1-oxidoreductase beta subunit [Limisphaerales bacterium]|jgi:isoquinoline 1-oxidoreductase beta subunit